MSSRNPSSQWYEPAGVCADLLLVKVLPRLRILGPEARALAALIRFGFFFDFLDVLMI